jgi:hypothetical protein
MMVTSYDGACQCAPSKRQIAHWYRMLEVTIIAKIQTVSIENIFYDGDIVRWRMSMRTQKRILMLVKVRHSLYVWPST